MIFKDSNFSEQTAWISVTFTVFIAWFYANGMKQLEGTFSSHADQIVSLWAQTIIASIIFVAIAFIALAILKKATGDDDIALIDERDELIEARATRWAYYNLSTCIIILFFHIFCQGIITNYPFFPNVPPIDFLIHGVMFSSLLVEFILRASQIYRYRKAA